MEHIAVKSNRDVNQIFSIIDWTFLTMAEESIFKKIISLGVFGNHLWLWTTVLLDSLCWQLWSVWDCYVSRCCAAVHLGQRLYILWDFLLIQASACRIRKSHVLFIRDLLALLLLLTNLPTLYTILTKHQILSYGTVKNDYHLFVVELKNTNSQNFAATLVLDLWHRSKLKKELNNCCVLLQNHVINNHLWIIKNVGATCAQMIHLCHLSHCWYDRSTDTTGQWRVRAADEPSLDPVFRRDSDASASATAATAWPPLMRILPPLTLAANRSQPNVRTGVPIGPASWTMSMRWRWAE